MNGYRQTLKKLSDLLGNDHDLAVLRQTLLDHLELCGNERDLQVLLGVMDKSQAELKTEAKLLGQRIFAEKPRSFCNRINQYWDTWQAEERDLPLWLGHDNDLTGCLTQ